jgi:hypothetical protein
VFLEEEKGRADRIVINITEVIIININVVFVVVVVVVVEKSYNGIPVRSFVRKR